MMPTVELQIEDIAFGGKGVGRLDGKAVFVPFTIAGERIQARIVREKKNFVEADLLEVLAASPKRTRLSARTSAVAAGAAISTSVTNTNSKSKRRR